MAPGGRRGGGQRGRQAGADGRAESAQSGAAPPRRVRAGAGARGGRGGGMRPLTALYIGCPRSEPSAGRRGGEGRGAGVGPRGAPCRGRCLCRRPAEGLVRRAGPSPCVGAHTRGWGYTRDVSVYVCALGRHAFPTWQTLLLSSENVNYSQGWSRQCLRGEERTASCV